MTTLLTCWLFDFVDSWCIDSWHNSVVNMLLLACCQLTSTDVSTLLMWAWVVWQINVLMLLTCWSLRGGSVLLLFLWLLIEGTGMLLPLLKILTCKFCHFWVEMLGGIDGILLIISFGVPTDDIDSMLGVLNFDQFFNSAVIWCRCGDKWIFSPYLRKRRTNWNDLQRARNNLKRPCNE